MKIKLYAAPEARGKGDGSSFENAIGGLDAVIAASRTIEENVTVNLSPGVYQLENTLLLDERDSGTTFIGDNAVISGAAPLAAWKYAGDGIVYSEVSPSSRPTQFYVNGERREAAAPAFVVQNSVHIQPRF